jgi:hypothetical protein
MSGLLIVHQGRHLVSKTKIELYVAIAEISASVAVVVSLVFVVVSLNRNTAAVQASNDNFLYQLEDARMAEITGNQEMADLFFRASSGEELGQAELFRYEYWVLRQLNIWEVAFIRYRDGLMPNSQWQSWDESLSSTVTARLSSETWNRYRNGYRSEFRSHVDAAYEAK